VAVNPPAMPKRFDAWLTMLVHVKGHPVLGYYFAVADTRQSANDIDARQAGSCDASADATRVI
jgi:hypothetical protein